MTVTQFTVSTLTPYTTTIQSMGSKTKRVFMMDYQATAAPAQSGVMLTSPLYMTSDTACRLTMKSIHPASITGRFLRFYILYSAGCGVRSLSAAVSMLAAKRCEDFHARSSGCYCPSGSRELSAQGRVQLVDIRCRPIAALHLGLLPGPYRAGRAREFPAIQRLGAAPVFTVPYRWRSRKSRATSRTSGVIAWSRCGRMLSSPWGSVR